MYELLEIMTLTPPKEFKVLVPRFIATFFMHAAMQGEIKSGIRIMKYVVNHPYSFRTFAQDHHDKEEEKEST
jgi:hypothetical protein